MHSSKLELHHLMHNDAEGKNICAHSYVKSFFFYLKNLVPWVLFKHFFNFLLHDKISPCNYFHLYLLGLNIVFSSCYISVSIIHILSTGY